VRTRPHPEQENTTENRAKKIDELAILERAKKIATENKDSKNVGENPIQNE
jgi:hypothetical protein